MALSLPPWGWWPLAFAGAAMALAALDDRSARQRALLGWLSGLAFFGISLFWFSEFTGPGAVLGIAVEALFFALAALAVPPTGGGRRAISFPAALVVVEGLRDRFPFGGVPIGGLHLGQSGGPLLAAARVGGPLLVVALVATAGIALTKRVGVVTRATAAAIVIAVVVLSAVAPKGEPTGRAITVGAVQGGGRRGLRASQNDPTDVYQAHVDATAELKPPLDLIVWPENVVDVEGPVARTAAAGDLAAIARTYQATLVSGVVEGQRTDHFRNAAVAWSPAGAIVGRYEKVHRVPFGEWVPGRALVEKLANLADVPEDAIVGHGPNVLATPAGRLGVAISYEVFFADRGRAATARGAELMLVPTNAASFRTSQVPTQELGAARFLAVETGRSVIQAGPTGYTAVVGADGRIRARSVLGRRQVLTATVALRHGRTLYGRWGDLPWLALSLALVILSWFLTGRSRASLSAHA
jgi:apolipoprotein N-acyltransferase